MKNSSANTATTSRFTGLPPKNKTCRSERLRGLAAGNECIPFGLIYLLHHSRLLREISHRGGPALPMLGEGSRIPAALLLDVSDALCRIRDLRPQRWHFEHIGRGQLDARVIHNRLVRQPFFIQAV